MHSVDLGEEPRCRAVIVDGIRLDLTQGCHLSLKVPNPLEARVELVVIRDQDASETISTTPARVASDGLSRSLTHSAPPTAVRRGQAVVHPCPAGA